MRRVEKTNIDELVSGSDTRQSYGHYLNVLTVRVVDHDHLPVARASCPLAFQAEKLAVISLHSVLSLLMKVRARLRRPGSVVMFIFDTCWPAGRGPLRVGPGVRGQGEDLQSGAAHWRSSSSAGMIRFGMVPGRVCCFRQLDLHIAPPLRQVNLAKLDAYARMEGGSGQKPSKHVASVQAANILAARAKLEDALWEPWLRAKVRSPWRHVRLVFVAHARSYGRVCRLAACC